MMDRLLSADEKPSWFVYPDEFNRTVELGLINLEPWSVLFGSELREKLQGLRIRYPERELVPFAQRQDNDDVVCWEKGDSNKVVLIHDYASPGYEQRRVFDDFWLWFKSAIDDMIYFE
jgi:hypothetical protein